MRRYVGLGLALAASCAPAARAPSPETILLDAGAVRFSLDSISVRSALERKEQAACVTRWRILDATKGTGRLYVLLAIGPARADSTDSLHIYGAHFPCAPQFPSIHSHVVDNGYLRTPSDVDVASARRESIAPFQVLLVGGTADVVLYALRPPLRVDP